MCLIIEACLPKGLLKVSDLYKTLGIYLFIITISITLQQNRTFAIRSTTILDISQTSKLSFWIFGNADSGEQTMSAIKANNEEPLATSKIAYIYQDLLGSFTSIITLRF